MGKRRKRKEFIPVEVLLPEGPSYEEIIPSSRFLNHVRELIGGYVASYTSGDVVLLVDEDGLMKELPPNMRASAYYEHPQPVVGTAVLVSAQDWLSLA